MEVSFIADLPLYAALALLGLAYFLRTYSLEERKDRDGKEGTGRKRIVRRTAYSPDIRRWQIMSSVGWAALGLVFFYLAFTSLFRSSIRSMDYVNGAIFLLVLPFCLYIAYQEWLSVQYRQEMKTLRFLNGVVFLFMLPATLVERVPALSGAIIYGFAWQSAELLSLFGYDTSITSIDYSGNPLLYRTNDLFISTDLVHGSSNDMQIIVSCTAFPSMLLFLAAIACSSVSVREKLRTGLLVVGLIHVLNVIRVSLSMFLIYEGRIDDYFAHAVAGKIGSIVILLLLVILLFRRIPEIRDYIIRLFILHRRRKPDATETSTTAAPATATSTTVTPVAATSTTVTPVAATSTTVTPATETSTTVTPVAATSVTTSGTANRENAGKGSGETEASPVAATEKD